MARRNSEDDRECGECDLCLHLLQNIPADGDEKLRSTKFSCIWRDDYEGVITKPEHRPDKTGVILKQDYCTNTNNDVLQVWLADPKYIDRAGWLQKILDGVRPAIHTQVFNPYTPTKVRSKGAAISRSGVLAFFRHKGKKGI